MFSMVIDSRTTGVLLMRDQFVLPADLIRIEQAVEFIKEKTIDTDSSTMNFEPAIS